MPEPDYTREAAISINKESINYITLAVFAPLLILVGVAGFIIPPQVSLTSGAAPYNLFHIFFGVVGLVVLWSKSEFLISFFNLGFGIIDLYQALASYLQLPPKPYFLWTGVDDILHVVIGLLLVTIGASGLYKGREV